MRILLQSVSNRERAIMEMWATRQSRNCKQNCVLNIPYTNSWWHLDHIGAKSWALNRSGFQCCALCMLHHTFRLTTLTVGNHPKPCELIDAIQTSLAILPRSMRYGSIAISQAPQHAHKLKLNTRHARVYYHAQHHSMHNVLRSFDLS